MIYGQLLHTVDFLEPAQHGLVNVIGIIFYLFIGCIFDDRHGVGNAKIAIPVGKAPTVAPFRNGGGDIQDHGLIGIIRVPGSGQQRVLLASQRNAKFSQHEAHAVMLCHSHHFDAACRFTIAPDRQHTYRIVRLMGPCEAVDHGRIFQSIDIDCDPIIIVTVIQHRAGFFQLEGQRDALFSQRVRR